MPPLEKKDPKGGGENYFSGGKNFSPFFSQKCLKISVPLFRFISLLPILKTKKFKHKEKLIVISPKLSFLPLGFATFFLWANFFF